jgi:hypothetical protein
MSNTGFKPDTEIRAVQSERPKPHRLPLMLQLWALESDLLSTETCYQSQKKNNPKTLWSRQTEL